MFLLFFREFLIHIVPDNFIGAFAKGELLQVVVLAVMVGIGIRRHRDIDRHLYPERYPETAREDDELDNSEMLPEHQELKSGVESSARRP